MVVFTIPARFSERTDKAAVVEANMGWSDIGSWSALWQLTKGEDGNALSGDVHVIELGLVKGEPVAVVEPQF